MFNSFREKDPTSDAVLVRPAMRHTLAKQVELLELLILHTDYLNKDRNSTW